MQSQRQRGGDRDAPRIVGRFGASSAKHDRRVAQRAPSRPSVGAVLAQQRPVQRLGPAHRGQRDVDRRAARPRARRASADEVVAALRASSSSKRATVSGAAVRGVPSASTYDRATRSSPQRAPQTPPASARSSGRRRSSSLGTSRCSPPSIAVSSTSDHDDVRRLRAARSRRRRAPRSSPRTASGARPGRTRSCGARRPSPRAAISLRVGRDPARCLCARRARSARRERTRRARRPDARGAGAAAS